MNNNYLFQIIKRNWKAILIFILCLFVGGFLVKNISESPYENKHLLNTTYPLKFQYKDIDVRGMVYVSYWVETKAKLEKRLTEDQLLNYVQKNGELHLKDMEEDFIAVLKTYSPEEIKQYWLDDNEYFKNRTTYFIESDPRLKKLIKKEGPDVDLPYELKKVFFIYFENDKFSKYLKTH